MQTVPTIAVLADSPALASVLAATLRRKRDWRVREFRHLSALDDYIHIAPLTLLVTDFQLGHTTAADFARTIRNDETVASRSMQIIALSRTISPQMRRQCVEAGIDEVIVKPMSPLYLEERVAARIASGPTNYVTASTGYLGPDRRNRIPLADARMNHIERRGENIVSFFAHKSIRDQGPDTPRPSA